MGNQSIFLQKATVKEWSRNEIGTPTFSRNESNQSYYGVIEKNETINNMTMLSCVCVRVSGNVQITRRLKLSDLMKGNGAGIR